MARKRKKQSMQTSGKRKSPRLSIEKPADQNEEAEEFVFAPLNDDRTLDQHTSAQLNNNITLENDQNTSTRLNNNISLENDQNTSGSLTENTTLVQTTSSREEPSARQATPPEVIDVDELPDRPDSPIGDDVIEIIPPPSVSSNLMRRNIRPLNSRQVGDSVVIISPLRTLTPPRGEDEACSEDELPASFNKHPPSLNLPKDSPDEKYRGKQATKKTGIHCPICMDSSSQIISNGRQLTSTMCGHIFCNTCISASLLTLKSCPTCRKKLQKKQLHPLFI